MSVEQRAKPFVGDTQTQGQTHKPALRQAQIYTNTGRQKTTDGMVNEKSGEFKSGFTFSQVTSRGCFVLAFP